MIAMHKAGDNLIVSTKPDQIVIARLTYPKGIGQSQPTAAIVDVTEILRFWKAYEASRSGVCMDYPGAWRYSYMRNPSGLLAL